MDAIKTSHQRIKKSRSHLATPDAETLNFKVSGEFKREFKGYAVSQGVSMVELLKEGFELTKKKRKSTSAGA